MAKATEAKDEGTGLFVVKLGFYAEPLPYREGEVVHPDDPFLKLMPDRFEPFAFPHPVKRRGSSAPEVRAE